MFKRTLYLTFCIIIELTYFSNVQGQRPIDSLKATPIEINESNILYPKLGPCRIEDSLQKVFKNVGFIELVEELKKPDFHYQCWMSRYYRTFSKRQVIQARLCEDRNSATPYLIKFIKRESPEFQAIALEVIQWADQSTLEPYENLFLKTSKSQHPAVRNRSLSILARIKNPKIERIILNRLKSIPSNWAKKYNYSLNLMMELLLYSPIDRVNVEKGLIHLLENHEISDGNLTQIISLMHSFNLREESEAIIQKYVYWLNHHSNPGVIDRSAEGLSKVATGIPYLIEALNHSNVHVRASSAINLTQHRDFSLADHDEAIRKILTDSQPIVLQYFFNGISWLKLAAEQKKELLKKMVESSSEVNKNTRVDYGLYMLRQFLGIPVEDFNFISQEESKKVLSYFETLNSDETYQYIFRSSTKSIVEHNQLDFQFDSESKYLDLWRELLNLD